MSVHLPNDIPNDIPHDIPYDILYQIIYHIIYHIMCHILYHILGTIYHISHVIVINVIYHVLFFIMYHILYHISYPISYHILYHIISYPISYHIMSCHIMIVYRPGKNTLKLKYTCLHDLQDPYLATLLQALLKFLLLLGVQGSQTTCLKGLTGGTWLDTLIYPMTDPWCWYLC